MTIGHVAYNAYCEQRNWKSVKGDLLPPFTAQSAELITAWEAAAGAVLALTLRNLTADLSYLINKGEFDNPSDL